MASYSVNPDGVAYARQLIDSGQYVQDSDWGKAHRAITEAARKIARDNSVLAPLREGQTDAAAPAKISHRILALPQLQHG